MWNQSHGGIPHGTNFAYSPPGGPPPQQGPPPGADSKLWQSFVAVDKDNSRQISATELQEALVKSGYPTFELDTVKLLMGMFDRDRSGKIGFQDFVGLLQYIKDWQNVFIHFDTNKSGFLEGNDLRNAMAQFGYNLNPQLLQLLESKYASAVPAQYPVYGQQRIGITFDRFVCCCVVVKQLTESFLRLDTQRTGNLIGTLSDLASRMCLR